MANPEKEFSPGENRVEAEINHVVHDAEIKDWNEVLSQLTSDLPRAIEAALESMTLSNEQKLAYEERLDEVEASIQREPDFEDKQAIIAAIERQKDKFRMS